MTVDGEDSVTQWVSELKAGDRCEAPRRLLERYFEQLARLAQARLRTGGGAVADGEDVALSVFESFFRGAGDGRFPDLDNRDNLWRLLVTITTRKAINRRRDEGRQKRGGGRIARTQDLAGKDNDLDDFLAQVVGSEPTPEFAALVADEYRRLFGSLADESLRVVAQMKMENYSDEDIARSLDCSVRTVERKLKVIRKRWTAEESS
jgi:DNA-directed RNA polymerase specialized sigma24 family protein